MKKSFSLFKQTQKCIFVGYENFIIPPTDLIFTDSTTKRASLPRALSLIWLCPSYYYVHHIVVSSRLMWPARNCVHICSNFLVSICCSFILFHFWTSEFILRQEVILDLFVIRIIKKTEIYWNLDTLTLAVF